ncbi:MAG TPA: DNA-processing protein DprA, partial [Pontimonas sp.]|nr:DNA-processing protein DprA [Pontimonas sp.]
ALLLGKRLNGLSPPVETLAEYRRAYRPERLELSLALQRERDTVAISAGHPWWPARLEDLGSYAPRTLWVAGSLQHSSHTQGVALVGNHVPTRAGRQAALSLADVALERGVTIMSGGSRGIATDAHRRAVHRGGISLAVLAGGLDALYPPENASLFQRVRQRGALISESPHTVELSTQGFLRRNRIIAALAEGTVVVQAEYRSGAISVGYHAAALGRHVGVVPASWHDTHSAGCWRIYRECGAIVLTEPAELSLVIPGVPFPTPRYEARTSHDRV